ncbi:hypothetical protein [Sporosarcina sp. SAFN-015]|uniref:hypothetical protein n=1 Tax=Sporosarcina sp. SAFN-015 TaxID=3387274 RepID=UPI003F7CFB5E
MKATTHGIFALAWAFLAAVNVVLWAIIDDITLLVIALIFYVFSAEHGIIAAIKRKEDV